MVSYAQGSEVTWQDMADMADDFAHYFSTATVGSYLGVSVSGTKSGRGLHCPLHCQFFMPDPRMCTSVRVAF